MAQRRFLWYGLAPLMYSGGIAAGALFLSDALGIGLYVAAVIAERVAIPWYSARQSPVG